jgi:hypothetical protein
LRGKAYKRREEVKGESQFGRSKGGPETKMGLAKGHKLAIRKWPNYIAPRKGRMGERDGGTAAKSTSPPKQLAIGGKGKAGERTIEGRGTKKDKVESNGRSQIKK